MGEKSLLPWQPWGPFRHRSHVNCLAESRTLRVFRDLGVRPVGSNHPAQKLSCPLQPVLVPFVWPRTFVGKGPPDCFAVYLLPKNLRLPLPPDSKVWKLDAHSNLVFLHFPAYLTCPSFLIRQESLLGMPSTDYGPSFHPRPGFLRWTAAAARSLIAGPKGGTVRVWWPGGQKVYLGRRFWEFGGRAHWPLFAVGTVRPLMLR